MNGVYGFIFGVVLGYSTTSIYFLSFAMLHRLHVYKKCLHVIDYFMRCSAFIALLAQSQ